MENKHFGAPNLQPL